MIYDSLEMLIINYLMFRFNLVIFLHNDHIITLILKYIYIFIIQIKMYINLDKLQKRNLYAKYSK